MKRCNKCNYGRAHHLVNVGKKHEVCNKLELFLPCCIRSNKFFNQFGTFLSRYKYNVTLQSRDKASAVLKLNIAFGTGGIYLSPVTHVFSDLATTLEQPPYINFWTQLTASLPCGEDNRAIRIGS